MRKILPFMLLAGVVGYGLVMLWRNQACPMRLGGQCMQVERVATPELLERGLSGRSDLAPDRAMLFVFEQAGDHCFWMKDMRFSIDMIWLDDHKKIVKIADNVAPGTYPNSFCPGRLAKYVIEVNAGTAKAAGLRPGARISF